MLDILSYPDSTIGLTVVGLEENFLNEGAQISGKCYLEIGFCKYSIS